MRVGEKEVLVVIAYSREVLVVGFQKNGQLCELVGVISLHCETTYSAPALLPAFD